MSVVQIVTILGSIPLFSLRTFLPAFLTALFLTYPQYFPGMDDVPPAPEDDFITKNWVLIILGILSILEIVGDKSSEIRSLVKNAETYLKPICFLLINLSLLDNTSLEVLKDIQWAGFDPHLILLVFGSLAVHWLASLRRDFITFLENMDEDDNLFIGRIISWVEDSLVLFGFLLLIWAGILMVAIYTIAIAFFIFMGRRYEKKLDQQKIECPQCKGKNLPFAVKCYNCKTELLEVHAIGILGQRKRELTSNIYKHQLELLSHKKCPDCGNRMKQSKIYQTCEICGTQLFDTPTVKEFIKYQDKKFIKITGFSFLLGFIPVVGFVISAVLANIYLLSPYRRYIPTSNSFLNKLFIKVITFVFFLLGIALGFIAGPLYIVFRYLIWKRSFILRTKS